MMYVKCPECGEQTEYSDQNEHRPFCSRRCQLLDLGAWASEDRKIAGEKVFESEDDYDTRH
jgi:endogenous inhibitor of DNA gyrase (YacG/DUF329 family)